MLFVVFWVVCFRLFVLFRLRVFYVCFTFEVFYVWYRARGIFGVCVDWISLVIKFLGKFFYNVRRGFFLNKEK